MGFKKKLFFYASLFLMLWGCSKEQKNDDYVRKPAPKDKEAALKELSPQNLEKLEKWQNSLAKSCNVSEIFGKNGETTGIDGVLLIQHNENSLVFQDDENATLITGFNAPAGTFSSHIETTATINGQSSIFTAETKREGSHCEVYLYGHKIYETLIYETVEIGSEWKIGKLSEAKATFLPHIKPFGEQGLAETEWRVPNTHKITLSSLLSKAFEPTADSLKTIEKKLDLSEEIVQRHFVITPRDTSHWIVKIANEPTALWSFDSLIAENVFLQKNLYPQEHKPILLDVRLAIPTFTLGKTSNIADHGNYQTVLEYEIKPIETENQSSFVYSLKNIESKGLIPFNSEESIQCVKERSNPYLSVKKTNEMPSLSLIFNPCEQLFPQLKNISYENGLMRTFAQQIFTNIIPNVKYFYGGWDEALSHLALTSLNQNKDIVGTLDPEEKTRIVRIVAQNLEALKEQIEKSVNLHESKSLILDMGLYWSFAGYNVTESRITQILQNLDPVIAPFSESALQLLNNLKYNPNAFDDDLHFTQTIDSAYKEEALKALNLSLDLSYSDFKNTTFDRVIQNKISFDDLKYWSKNFSAIKKQMIPFNELKKVQNDLTSISIKWLKSGEAHEEDLSAIYEPLNKSIHVFTNSTHKLINDLNTSLLDQKKTLDFAQSISEEYRNLATSIHSMANEAELKDWGNTFFDNILQDQKNLSDLKLLHKTWVAALEFYKMEKIRSDFGTSHEIKTKNVLLKAIQELWISSDFTQLEMIANLVSFKFMCDREISMSALAECANLNLFSKEKNKFFDPAFFYRYGQFSKDLKEEMKQLNGFDWNTLRNNIIDAFFSHSNPLWAQCSQDFFQRKVILLKSQLNQIKHETDTFKKWDLEDKIRKTLNDCQ